MADPHKLTMQTSGSDDQSCMKYESMKLRKNSPLRHQDEMINPQDFLTKFSNIIHTIPPYLTPKRRREDHYRSTTPKFSEVHILEYKISIREKYKQENEKSFPFYKGVSLPLYTEPVISWKIGNIGFQNISVMRLFEQSFPQNNPRPVILQGSPGSGKSFICQKIMIDWASGEHYLQHFDLAFYLRCEELKCISEEVNLIELLSWSSSLTSDQISQTLQKPSCSVLFIIDGLDQLRIMHHEFWISSQFQKAPPEVAVYSMLSQQVLDRSFLLVTTRSEVPQDMLLSRPPIFSKIVGFSKNEVKVYFQKFFQDNEFFRKVFNCVKGNEPLFTTCSIPVICWIICTVLHERLSDDPDVINGLETKTSIYIEFVSTLLERHSQSLSQSVPTLLRSLGQLAERGMMDQQVLFDEKLVNVTVSDSTDSPFLNKFLSKKSVHQKTMFSFTHRSFQEFFTALYYVLLDEDESQRKVKELLHTVERGWALSCWSDTDLSMADEEVKHSELLQPVILFLCGLCKKERIPSFFQKHNMSVSVNIETQLKDWISQCSLRYQNEHMLFILHCLFELHQKSFTGKVLEGLILVDLSKTPLKNEDCWMLQFCLQSCVKISSLRLTITSDNMKTLQSALYSCERLWMKVDHITDEIGDLISAFSEGKRMKELIIQTQNVSNTFEKRTKSFCQEIFASVKDGDVTLSVCFSKTRVFSLMSKLTLTCSRSTTSWRTFLQQLHELQKSVNRCDISSVDEFLPLDVLHSVSGLKKLHLQTEKWNDGWIPKILSLVQAFPSLKELRINAAVSFIPFYATQTLRESLTYNGWNLTVLRKTVLIERDRKRKDIAVLFTPDHVEDNEDKHKNKYRFVCPRAGQFRCSLTGLVFVVEAEAELLYKTLSWDPRLLDGLGQMQPAGPLYNVDCFKSSVSQLHLPHCEILSEENKDVLAVAHYSGGNVEIMKPLEVTETQVMIDIKDLSIFGLIKRILFPPSPVVAQVLFFLRPKTMRQRDNILDVHLLPCNVSVSEVKEQHAENTHIKTSSKCSLTPGTQYSLICQPETTTVQPETEMFECNFGPNYHPTFEVFVDVNTEEVRLGLKTEGKEVWLPRRILLTGKDEDTPAYKKLKECEFVEKHRRELVQRVTSAMAIADGLRSENMITDEIWSEIRTAEPRRKKTRLLLDALVSGGASVKAEFYRLLKEEESRLVDDLESGPSSVSMTKH